MSNAAWPKVWEKLKDIGIFPAILGIAAGIILAENTITMQPKDVDIAVYAKETIELIPTASITVVNPKRSAIVRNIDIVQTAEMGKDNKIQNVRNGNYMVMAFADNYGMKAETVNLHSSPWWIGLEKISSGKLKPVPFIFGWKTWTGLSANPRGNTVALNSTGNTAGYMTLDAKPMAGRKLVLDITGTKNSTFHNGQLLKLEADDKALAPDNVPMLIADGYIPVINGRFIFAIPDSFEGKINLVFYRAVLNNLQIAAFYE